MSERIFEEIAVVIKQKYTVRFLEYKEKGSEFTEINVYGNEITEKDEDLSDYFTFGFTVKGRAEKEKEKIEKMNEKQFEEFISHMTHFIENKYNVAHQKETKKDEKSSVFIPYDNDCLKL
jgi:predicted transcriptional regulator